MRLEMSILTEDWDKMDSIIEENALNPINIAECPNAISVSIFIVFKCTSLELLMRCCDVFVELHIFGL